MDHSMNTKQLLYLYGVVPAALVQPVTLDAPIQTLTYASITALVEPVPALEFAPSALEEKLGSLDWVAHLAHKHEAVLERAMRHGPVVPARLCTLFHSAESLCLCLAEQEERFCDLLEQLQGREEWSLKVYCAEGTLNRLLSHHDQQLLELDAALAEASPGQAFVLRKRREAHLAQLSAAYIDALVDRTLESIEQVAVDLRLRELLSPTAVGRDEPMVINIAALITATGREAFLSAIMSLSEQFQDEGFAFETSGPWPPYSFSAAEQVEQGLDPAQLDAVEEE